MMAGRVVVLACCILAAAALQPQRLKGTLHHVSNLSTAKLNSTQVKSTVEIEIALGVVPVKSKVALAVISGMGFGFCGIDRCYLGSPCLGITKGLTLGGMGIWFLIDFFVILVNMMQKRDRIDAIGFHAKFRPKEEIDTAFWIAAVLFLLKAVASVCGTRSRREQREQ
eukprot:TRINITY_DN33907_c0_g1_i1.p1 TRINITY_DN33907_c0_g1~~TRINITY_DN33907_c0_g1_i1.p1  ORF type:complete len:184 (-),score=24.50 TRINITY_DN33907_c0_g1_i1:97-600(-)